jgi:hypothetical protein
VAVNINNPTDILDGPMVRICRSHRQGQGSIPCLGIFARRRSCVRAHDHPYNCTPIRRLSGLVVMTFVLHTNDRRFDPGLGQKRRFAALSFWFARPRTKKDIGAIVCVYL